MDISLSDTLEFPVEHIVPSVDISQIENFSHFSAVRLAKKYYEKLGFVVLEGENFENNLLLYFYDNEDRLFCDEYIKVKLGKAHATTDAMEYSETILGTISIVTVKILLQLCRSCSYTGDPGFPDLIILNKNWQLNYVLFDELSTSQKMFLLLSRLMGIGVEIVNLAPEGKSIEIDLSHLLNSVVNDRRARNIMDGLEANIKEAEEKASQLNDPIYSDELNYLLNEKRKNPLFLFNGWLEKKILSSQDLFELVDFTLANSRHNFDKYVEDLEGDPTFAAMKHLKTEEAMRRKAEYMQKKFGIGRSRSKMLLNFF